MSYTETKFVVRAELKQLRGASFSQALDFFRPILGEPYETDHLYDDYVLTWFEYEQKKGSIVPVYLRRNDVMYWGVEYIIDQGNYTHDMTTYLDFDELDRCIYSIVELFDTVDSEDILICAYSWYNGGDEPIKFKGVNL